MSARATDHSALVVGLRGVALNLDRYVENDAMPARARQGARADALRYRAVVALLMQHDEQRINLYDHPDLLAWVIFEAGQAVGPVTVSNNYC
jgi:hypothetical protein